MGAELVEGSHAEVAWGGALRAADGGLGQAGVGVQWVGVRSGHRGDRAQGAGLFQAGQAGAVSAWEGVAPALEVARLAGVTAVLI